MSSALPITEPPPSPGRRPPEPQPDVSRAPRQAPATCPLTASNIEGPFYKPGAPHRARLGPRTTLVVEGRVVDDRCRPIPFAELDLWQADERGAYDDEGFGHRAQLRTGPDGRYRFETVRPGHYLNGDRYRPAHIHVKLRASGHRPLTSQLYFPDDAYNDGDPFILPSLIMDLGGPSHAGELASYDFVLARL